MDYGAWQGVEKATGTMAATGMKLLEMQATQRHQMALEANQAAHLQLAKDQAQIQNATANIALDEARKKQAEYDRLIDINTHPAFLALPDSVKPTALKYFADNKYTDANGVGKSGDIINGVGNIEKSKTLFQTFMEPVVREKQTAVMQAWSEYQQAKTTGDQKKAAAAMEKFNQLNGDYYGSLGKFEEHMKILTQQEGKETIEKMKIEAEKEKQIGIDQREALKEAGRNARNDKRIAASGGGGKPPAGYRQTADGNLEPIPGGPADFKQQQVYAKDTASKDALIAKMDQLAEEARSLKAHKGLGGITGIAGTIPNIPGSQSSDAQAKLDTLISKTATTVLQDMRNSSQTGGALGQVSDKDIELLKTNISAVGRKQSVAAFKKSLGDIEKFANDTKQRINKAYDLKWNSKSTPTARRVGRFTVEEE